jgi:hypothetical protein
VLASAWPPSAKLLKPNLRAIIAGGRRHLWSFLAKTTGVHLQRQPQLPDRQGRQSHHTRAVRSDRRTGPARFQRRTSPILRQGNLQRPETRPKASQQADAIHLPELQAQEPHSEAGTCSCILPLYLASWPLWYTTNPRTESGQLALYPNLTSGGWLGAVRIGVFLLSLTMNSRNS